MENVCVIISLKNKPNIKRVCCDTDSIFDCIMAVTHDNQNEAMRVQGWADLAYSGEVYVGDNFIAKKYVMEITL